MNNLQRQIERGEFVVIKQEIFNIPIEVSGRAFVCEGGFGMSPHTSGVKIVGAWADGTGEDVICGHWIDAAETAAFQAGQRAVPASTPEPAEAQTEVEAVGMKYEELRDAVTGAYESAVVAGIEETAVLSFCVERPAKEEGQRVEFLPANPDLGTPVVLGTVVQVGDGKGEPTILQVKVREAYQIIKAVEEAIAASREGGQ